MLTFSKPLKTYNYLSVWLCVVVWMVTVLHTWSGSELLSCVMHGLQPEGKHLARTHRKPDQQTTRASTTAVMCICTSHGDGGADMECTIITHVVYEQDNQCARVRRYFCLCIFYFFLWPKKAALPGSSLLGLCYAWTKGLTGKTVKYKLMEFNGFDCIFNVV